MRRDEPVFYVAVAPPALHVSGGAQSNAVALNAKKAALLKENQDILNLGPPTKADYDKIEANKVAIAAIDKQLAAPPPAPPPAPVTPQEPEDISRSVLSFEYEESEKKNDILKLTIENNDLRWFDSPAIEHGVVYHVTWGYIGALVPLRQVVVQKVTGDLTLTVECAGRGQLMHKTVKTRVFNNVTRAEVVRRIALEHGYGPSEQFIDEGPPAASTPNRAVALTAEVAAAKKRIQDILNLGPPTLEQSKKIAADQQFIVAAEKQIPLEAKKAAVVKQPTGSAPLYPSINQAAMTDAQFIRRLADLQGFEFYVDFSGLHWHPRRVEAKPTLELTYYLPPGVGDIISFSVENDITAKPAVTAVKGIDPVTKKEIDTTATDANTPRPTLAGTPDLPSQAKVVDPVTGETKMVAGGGGTPVTTVTTTSEPNAAAAKTEAQGQFTRNQQSSYKLKFSIVGNPRLAAKQVIKVNGLGKRLSGRYYVTTLRSKLDTSGFVQELETRSDGTNSGAAAGKVAAAKDSAGEPNTQDPAAGGTGALTPKKVVDPVTGETKTIFTQG